MNPNEIKDLSIKTLADVCNHEDAPAAAKAAAARTLLEAIGVIGKNSTGGDLDAKSLSEMTAAELDREIARLSRDAAAPKALKSKG